MFDNLQLKRSDELLVIFIYQSVLHTHLFIFALTLCSSLRRLSQHGFQQRDSVFINGTSVIHCTTSTTQQHNTTWFCLHQWHVGDPLYDPEHYTATQHAACTLHRWTHFSTFLSLNSLHIKVMLRQTYPVCNQIYQNNTRLILIIKITGSFC